MQFDDCTTCLIKVYFRKFLEMLDIERRWRFNVLVNSLVEKIILYKQLLKSSFKELL